MRDVNLLAWVGLIACWGCGGLVEDGAAAKGAERTERAVVYGADDRREYFQVTGDEGALFDSTVTLMTRASAEALVMGEVSSLRTWGQQDGLCAGEPFADQPAAGFCSGVLVDWDLVLTARHCADLFELSDVRVVSGYYYVAAGLLGLTKDDVRTPVQVIATSAPAAGDSKADFAWLRLDRPVRGARRPAAVRARAPGPNANDAIVSVSAGGGVPAKLDAAGIVRDVDAPGSDHFTADTDTSGGSSGGGAFSAGDLSLVGTLARGAPDFDDTDAGCAVTRRVSDGAMTKETYTAAWAAVAGLCAVEPERAVCDPTCEEPCRVAAAPEDGGAAGCQVSGLGSERPEGRLASLVALAGLVAARARGGRRDARHRGQRKSRI